MLRAGQDGVNHADNAEKYLHSPNVTLRAIGHKDFLRLAAQGRVESVADGFSQLWVALL